MVGTDVSSERGVALLIVLAAIVLLSAVGAALVMTTSTDVLIAANAGAATEAAYAADAAFERALAELRLAPDLTSVLDGTRPSQYVDGAPSGVRTLSDGSTLVLGQVLNRADCQKPAGCSTADLDATLRGRPWGAANPRWRLFSYGPLDGGSGLGPRGAPVYLVTMVADDPAEDDGDPWRDGARLGVTANPGAGVLLVRAEAFGRRGASRVVEGVLLRLDLQALAQWDASDPLTRGPAPAAVPVLQVLSRREVR